MFVCVLSFALVFAVPRASDTAQLVAPTLVFSSSVRSVCKPIPSTLSLCHGIGYRQMRVPNLLGHDTLREAQQQSAAWLPLVSKLCHRDTKKFLCSLFAPVCLPELTGPVSPCRSLCEAVRDGCVPVMSAFGFPWPEMFNCSRFPRGTELCIPPTEEHEMRTAEEVSVICDACSLAAEGETDIQENFCHSSYGKDKLIQSTLAEGVGGAMAHSALWLQDGGTCTCPEQTDKKKEGNGSRPPWYLALAQADEGRLVLTRLVRWSRGEKELRKFIRALLRHSCPAL
uniref:FZ domain-containing protein n=1 Tax=Mola mola TaxID=94237 RepID=A0A3Q4B7C9_MOLML